ncbi:phosphotransferase family protein [Ideonella sp. A 288]|uniref:phosphotransferase family protein n=1 Tax=Ideonella sp. A 288 TaxID=1962181 RepID=UPI000B4ADD49|nr:phosphotransferase family protein [Ideonella sp. A 288]
MTLASVPPVEPELVEVLSQHRIDASAVAAWLRPHLGAAFDGQVQLRQFQGGQSNPTYHVATNVGALVLRKKPPGQLLPSAHAVEREFRVMQALGDSGVPVPRMLALCEDASVIGTPFFVMHHVPGRLMGTRFAQHGTLDERRAINDDLVRALAALHRVDWRAVGLEGFGRPERYFERQMARWSAQWEGSRTEEAPAMESLRGWLQQHLPTDEEAAIVHGDYRLGNVLVHPTEPRIVAVLDWELATIGHPLADLAYLCIGHHLPPSEGGFVGLDLAAEGVPTQDECVARYCAHAGREVPADIDRVVAFSMFRLAAICAGVYHRALSGNAADARALTFRDRFLSIAEAGWALAQRCSART